MLRPTICTVIAVGLARPALGAVINVGPGQSIQAAINIASDGDIVVVAPGTYNLSIDFAGKAVTVRSSGGPAVTTLDGAGLATTVVTCDSGEGPDSVLDGFTITGGEGTFTGFKLVGGGMRNDGSDPTVLNCVFVGNSADEGGAMWNSGADVTVTGCTFTGNTANGGGGGAVYDWSGIATYTSCTFVDNAASFGGGLFLKNGVPTVINCLFDGNSGGVGGGMEIFGCLNAKVMSCTFAGNNASSQGGAIYIVISIAQVSNSIMWGDTPDELGVPAGSTVTVSSSNVMGGWSGDGSNNMSQQPLFADPANGDYRLASGSPCIDQGDNSAVPPQITVDLDGNDRFVGQVDLGPYEQQTGGLSCPHDLDGDGSVAITDFLDLLEAWGTDPGGPPDFDGDGTVGITDFLDLLNNWGPCP